MFFELWCLTTYTDSRDNPSVAYRFRMRLGEGFVCLWPSCFLEVGTDLWGPYMVTAAVVLEFYAGGSGK